MLLQYFDGIKGLARLHRLIAVLLLKPASSRTCAQWCMEENAGFGRMLGTECQKQCSSHCAGHCIDGGPTAEGFSVSARDFSDYAGLEEACDANTTRLTKYPYCCCSYKKDDPLAFLEANLPTESCSSRCMGLAAGSGNLWFGTAPLCSAQCSTVCPATNYCEAATASTFTDYKATSDCTTAEQQVCCCNYPQLTTVARLRLLRTYTQCTTWIDPDASSTTETTTTSNGADTEFTINIYSNLDFRNGACHQVQSAPSNASIVSWNTQVATPGSYKIACLADSQEEFQFYESADCSGNKSSYFTLSMAGVSTFLHQGLCTEAAGTFRQVQLDMIDYSSYMTRFRSGCDTQTAVSDVTLPFQSPVALYVNMYKKFGTVSFARSLPIAVFAITIFFLVGESQ
mmetsp:Transcript_99532/g.156986  ORF Transcript_99532/g.156986 Transcript_99532/m.156986 type:complete len:399 (+) Transcript_99532:43-1239(+)